MSDVDLLLFEAGSLTDVTRRVVSDAVAPTHGVVIVAVTHDVAHAAGHTHTHTSFNSLVMHNNINFPLIIVDNYFMLKCIKY